LQAEAPVFCAVVAVKGWPPVKVTASQDKLLRIDPILKGEPPHKAALNWPHSGWHGRFVKNLAAFLKGKSVNWKSTGLDQCALSPFMQEVIREMRRIPRGEVKTYGQIAASLKKRGIKASPRAVGRAASRNPWALVVPCHRVVGTGGIGGFGWGLKWKHKLLALEGVKI